MDELSLPKSELVIYFHVFYNPVRCGYGAICRADGAFL